MGAYSGKNGTLKIGSTEIDDIKKWEFTESSNNPSWASNTSSGAKKRVAGVKDGSGSFEGNSDSAGHVPVQAGDSITLNLHVDASGTNYISGTAIIDSVKYMADMDTGEVVGYVANFSQDGAFTKHGVLATS